MGSLAERKRGDRCERRDAAHLPSWMLLVLTHDGISDALGAPACHPGWGSFGARRTLPATVPCRDTIEFECGRVAQD